MSEFKKQAIKGSCHCGKITYTVLITPPSPGQAIQAYRCNCTMCQKPGFVALPSSPKDFKLTSPASISELADYQFRSKDCHRYFCDRCGVQVFGEGKYELGGQSHDFFTVNLNTVDQPQNGIDLSHVKMAYFNGLTDGWMDGQKDKPFPGGTM